MVAAESTKKYDACFLFILPHPFACVLFLAKKGLSPRPPPFRSSLNMERKDGRQGAPIFVFASREERAGSRIAKESKRKRLN